MLLLLIKCEFLRQVTDPRMFWNWLNETLIPYLYSSHYQFSSQETSRVGGEFKSTVIGMLSLRQLRAKEGQ